MSTVRTPAQARPLSTVPMPGTMAGAFLACFWVGFGLARDGGCLSKKHSALRVQVIFGDFLTISKTSGFPVDNPPNITASMASIVADDARDAEDVAQTESKMDAGCDGMIGNS